MELELKGRSCIRNTMTEPISINLQTSSLSRDAVHRSAAAHRPVNSNSVIADHYLNTSWRCRQVRMLSFLQQQIVNRGEQESSGHPCDEYHRVLSMLEHHAFRSH